MYQGTWEKIKGYAYIAWITLVFAWIIFVFAAYLVGMKSSIPGTGNIAADWCLCVLYVIAIYLGAGTWMIYRPGVVNASARVYAMVALQIAISILAGYLAWFSIALDQNGSIGGLIANVVLTSLWIALFIAVYSVIMCSNLGGGSIRQAPGATVTIRFALPQVTVAVLPDAALL